MTDSAGTRAGEAHTGPAGKPALVWTGDGPVVRDVPEPAPADGWILVDVAYTGLCGTDLHILAGEHPRAQPGIVLGHEISGTLRQAAGGLAAGTKVLVDPLLNCGHCPSCRAGRPHNCAALRLLGIDLPGGATSTVAVPVDRIVPVPADTDLRLLAFAEPLAVAIRAVRQSGLTIGESCIVVGAGPVGLAVALVARSAGAGAVLVVEPSKYRRETAAALGFDTAAAVSDGDADVAFDAAGHPAVAATITETLAPAGRLVFVAVYGSPTALDLQAVTFKELRIIGTRVYSRSDITAAAQMVANGRFDATPLITRTVPLAEACAAITNLRDGTAIKILLEGRS